MRLIKYIKYSLFLLFLSQTCNHCLSATFKEQIVEWTLSGLFGEIGGSLLSLPGYIWSLIEIIVDYWPNEKEFRPVKILRELSQWQKIHKGCMVNRSKDLVELKKLFDSFNTSTDSPVVNAVYLRGLPSTGKSELARQYGNLVADKHGVSTVITLNAESEVTFRKDLIVAILNLTGNQKNVTMKEALKLEDTKSLVEWNLRESLSSRPKWLLIVDNIYDSNIEQQSFFQELPGPEQTERTWGNGLILFTTQVPLVGEESKQHARVISINDGMAPTDAIKLLCNLVRTTGNRNEECPDTKEAKDIVNKLEYYPLAIFAAGTFIQGMRDRFVRDYSLADYLVRVENETLEVLNDSYFKLSGYPNSTLTALVLALRRSMEQDSTGIIKNVCAFLVFSDLRQVSAPLMYSYLHTLGHNGAHIQTVMKDFPLVDYVANVRAFRAHQVTLYALQAEMDETDPERRTKYAEKVTSFLTAMARKTKVWTLEASHLFRKALTYKNRNAKGLLNDYLFQSYFLHSNSEVIFSKFNRHQNRVLSFGVYSTPEDFTYHILNCITLLQHKREPIPYKQLVECIEVLEVTVFEGVAQDVLSLFFELLMDRSDSIFLGNALSSDCVLERSRKNLLLIDWLKYVFYLPWSKLPKVCHKKPNLTKLLLTSPRKCFEWVLRPTYYPRRKLHDDYINIRLHMPPSNSFTGKFPSKKKWKGTGEWGEVSDDYPRFEIYLYRAMKHQSSDIERFRGLGDITDDELQEQFIERAIDKGKMRYCFKIDN